VFKQRALSASLVPGTGAQVDALQDACAGVRSRPGEHRIEILEIQRSVDLLATTVLIGGPASRFSG